MCERVRVCVCVYVCARVRVNWWVEIRITLKGARSTSRGGNRISRGVGDCVVMLQEGLGLRIRDGSSVGLLLLLIGLLLLLKHQGPRLR